MKNAIEYIINRLQEASTLRGLTYVLGGVGITVDPEYIKELIPIVFIIVGAINIWKKDASSKDSTVMETIKNE